MSKTFSSILRTGNGSSNPLPVSFGGTGVTTSTGSGNNVLSISPTLTAPTLVSPVLGTPSSGNLSNCTGYPVSSLSGSLGATITATANGFIAKGEAVYLKSDGTVAATANNQLVLGPETFLAANTYIYGGGSSVKPQLQTRTYNDAGVSRFILGYGSLGGSGNTSVVVGSLNSNNSISLGTPVSVGNTAAYLTSVGDDNGKVVFIMGTTTQASSVVTAFVGTLNGNSITFGTPTTLRTGYTSALNVGYDSTTQKYLVSYCDATIVYVAVGTVTGNTISFGTANTITYSSVGSTQFYSFPGLGKLILSYDSNVSVAKIVTITGTSVSFEDISINGVSAVGYDLFGANSLSPPSYDPYLQYMVGNRSGFNNGLRYVKYISGNNFTYTNQSGLSNLEYDISTSSVSTYDTNLKRFVTIGSYFSTAEFQQNSEKSNIIKTSQFDMSSIITSNTNSGAYGAIIDANTSKSIIAYAIQSSPNDVWIRALSFPKFTKYDVIGIATADYTNGQTATIATTGGSANVFSGLNISKTYYVNSITGVVQSSAGYINRYPIEIGKAISANNILLYKVGGIQ
jgi:hypothetical protein